MTPPPERNGRAWLLCLAAPLVWFAHFNALYGLASLGRATGASPASVGIVAWALTAAACIAIAAAWFWSQRSASSSTGASHGSRAVATWLALLALAGVLLQALALAIVPL